MHWLHRRLVAGLLLGLGEEQSQAPKPAQTSCGVAARDGIALGQHLPCTVSWFPLPRASQELVMPVMCPGSGSCSSKGRVTAFPRRGLAVTAGEAQGMLHTLTGTAAPARG